MIGFVPSKLWIERIADQALIEEALAVHEDLHRRPVGVGAGVVKGPIELEAGLLVELEIELCGDGA